ncbi:MAG: efflux RND transporter periplasmic adaptor subunit [Planctomycetota bacterium]
MNRELACLLWATLALTPGCSRRLPEASSSVTRRVEVARPVSIDASDTTEFNGRLEASQTVEIRSRVGGYLVKDAFPEGEEVKAGDLLFEVDPGPYQKAVDAAAAEVKAAEAQLKLADAEYNRARLLLTRTAVSPEEVDIRLGNQKVAASAVTSASAKWERAQLDLGFTQIRSPIAGRVSRKILTVGNLVSQTKEDVLTTVVTQDPAHLYFTVDERTYLRVDRRARARLARGETKSDGELPFLFRLEEERDFRHKGVIDFIENRFDQATGTITVRGVVKNPQIGKERRQFIPGMRARVKIETDVPYRALAVNEEAVLSDLRRRFVWVVKNGKAERVEVRVGESVAPGLRDIVEGISKEDLIVVKGIQFLRPGMPVETTETEMPGANRPAKASDR